ncbi:MAG: GerMN domain-containing protein, partial [Acidimicrobiia bacterium]|nr:GerMN domain-containing protein [Acidimicrobiia bacterium]
MNTALLDIIRRVLIAAVAILALIVLIAAFRRVIEVREPLAAPTTTAATTTTVATTTTDATTTTTTTVPEPPCEVPAVTPASGNIVLILHYSCGSALFPTGDTVVFREVPDTQLVITATTRALLEGPTAEEAEAGFRSPFGPEAGGEDLVNISLSSGRLVIDLADTATTGAESEAFLLGDLSATLFRFSSVSSVEYRLNGSCDDFWAIFGTACDVLERSQWEAQQAEWIDL